MLEFSNKLENEECKELSLYLNAKEKKIMFYYKYLLDIIHLIVMFISLVGIILNLDFIVYFFFISIVGILLLTIINYILYNEFYFHIRLKYLSENRFSEEQYSMSTRKISCIDDLSNKFKIKIAIAGVGQYRKVFSIDVLRYSKTDFIQNSEIQRHCVVIFTKDEYESIKNTEIVKLINGIVVFDSEKFEAYSIFRVYPYYIDRKRFLEETEFYFSSYVTKSILKNIAVYCNRK